MTPIFVAGDFPNPNNGNRIATRWGRAKVSSEHRSQKKAVFAKLLERFGYQRPALPVVVHVTRCSMGEMDMGGLWAALKWAEDAIAAYFGIEDADPRIWLVPGQRKVRERGIEIAVEPMAADRYESQLKHWHARRKRRRELPPQGPVPSLTELLKGTRRGAQTKTKQSTVKTRKKVS